MVLYHSGQGVEQQDLKEAFVWAMKAPEQHHREAQFGTSYYLGQVSHKMTAKH
jgi:TPR repeat protein